VPDLTDPAGGNQFLKWDAGFTGSTDATGPASDVHTGTGYSVTYYPTTGGGHTAGDVVATGC